MNEAKWPPLPYPDWKATCDTLHLFSQIPGKIRLALSPPERELNHVALQVTPRGLETPPIPYGDRTFALGFDLIEHAFTIDTSAGERTGFPIAGLSVRDFYNVTMRELAGLGIEPHITTMPNEVPNPVRFTDDTVHKAYDKAAVAAFHQILCHVDTSLRAHRATFTGRHSLVNFYWGSFDLAYSRYSGKSAPPPPGADPILAASLDAEEVAAGFWPGDDRFPEPAFYSYTYPKPAGLEAATLPLGGWNAEIGEFILRYDDVRTAGSPEDAIRDFLQATFKAGAERAGWDPELLS